MTVSQQIEKNMVWWETWKIPWEVRLILFVCLNFINFCTISFKVFHSSWKFFQEMSFVADANIEPDTARSTLDITHRSPASSSDGKEDSPATCSYQQPPSKQKQKVTTMDEETLVKRKQMYDAAIQFMQQPPPAPPQPKSDEDLFGEYQLKLINDHRCKLFIKTKINNLFLPQQMEQISAAAPSSTPLNNQFFSQDYGQYY